MAIALRRTVDGNETWSSSNVCSSAEIKYIAANVTNKADAIAAVFSNAPATYSNLVLKNVRVDSYQNGVAELSAVYGAASGGTNILTDGEVQESFDTSGGTRHVDIALYESCYDVEEESTYSMATPVIGWNGKSGAESKVDGVDVPCANPRLTYSKLFRMSELTTAYKRKLISMTTTVNDRTWRGWESGELLFLGAYYSGKREGSVQVTFSFQVMTNEANAEVGGHSIGAKEGWQYVWTQSATKKNSSGVPEVKITHIYKATIFEKTNFSELGI